jgi:hypothetical protein
MGNLLKATVRIKGTRPLIWHHFGPDAIPLEKQERTGVAGNDPEEWKKTVLATKEGALYVLPTSIFACLREAARHTKKKVGSIQADFSATVQVTDDFLLTNRVMPETLTENDFEAPVYLYVCSVKNPATKARNVRYRVASSAGWELQFHLLWDKTIVSRAQVEAVAIDAGKLSGLGDGRSIGFGRFEVTSFEVAEG